MLVIFVVIAFLASDCLAIHIGLVTESMETQMLEQGAELDESQREQLKEMVHAEQQARQLAKEQSYTGLDQLQKQMQQGLMAQTQKSSHKVHQRKKKHKKKKAKQENATVKPQNQQAVFDRFAPKQQDVFTPSAKKLHRSPLQEPDEIEFDGENGQTVQMEAPTEDPDAEFWSQVESEDPPKLDPNMNNDPDSVDSYGDLLNKASNEDIYAFSQVASSEEGVQSYLKNQEPKLDLAEVEGNPEMMADFIGDLQSKGSKISASDVDILRKSMGLKTQTSEYASEDDQAPEDFAAQFAVSIEKEQQEKKKTTGAKPAANSPTQFNNGNAKTDGKQSKTGKKGNNADDEDEEGQGHIESLVQSEFDVAHDEVVMDD